MIFGKIVKFLEIMLNEKKYLTDEEYKFIYERVPRLCLDFIIVKNGKILLAKRDIEPNKGDWHLPGGMVRYQESIDEAANRILKNELGLVPVSKKLIGYIEFPDEINKNRVHIHSISMAFLTTMEEGEIQGSSEASEIQFFKSLPKEYLHPIQGKFLRENWETLIV